MSLVPLTAEETFRRSEEFRREILVAADTDKLAAFLRDEFVYIHASGRSENKGEYIAGVASRRVRYLGYSGGARQVRIYGDVLVAHGTVTVLQVAGEGTPGSRTFWFSSVWTQTEASQR